MMPEFQASVATMVSHADGQTIQRLAYRVAAFITSPAEAVDPRNAAEVERVLIRVFESGYQAGHEAGRVAERTDKEG